MINKLKMTVVLLFITMPRRQRFLTCFLLLHIFLGGVVFAQNPEVRVRLSNPQVILANQTYGLDVEFQCDTPNQRLYGMNVRFFMMIPCLNL